MEYSPLYPKWNCFPDQSCTYSTQAFIKQARPRDCLRCSEKEGKPWTCPGATDSPALYINRVGPVLPGISAFRSSAWTGSHPARRLTGSAMELPLVLHALTEAPCLLERKVLPDSLSPREWHVGAADVHLAQKGGLRTSSILLPIKRTAVTSGKGEKTHSMSKPLHRPDSPHTGVQCAKGPRTQAMRHRWQRKSLVERPRTARPGRPGAGPSGKRLP